MTQVYAALEKGRAFVYYAYDPGPLGPHDVEIRMAYLEYATVICLCVVMLGGGSAYPFIGGHEISGTVVATGAQMRNVTVGDAVGLGWH